MTRLVSSQNVSFDLKLPPSLLWKAPRRRWAFSGPGLIPESPFHLDLGRPRTRPLPQLLSFPAAAALLVSKAGAGLTGRVAALTLSQLWVAVEARATSPDTRAVQEKEALFTPVALTLVTVATVGLTCFAFGFFSVGLLRTGLVAVLFKHVIPRSA